jgi:hypothetical protein
MKNLQLLRDVDIRWSSTLLMVERAQLLRAVGDLRPHALVLTDGNK